MTKNEGNILTEVATDVKWLKKQQEENALNTQRQLSKIEVHLTAINGGLSENNAQTAVNKSSIYRLWWLFGVICAIVTPILLKVFGIF